MTTSAEQLVRNAVKATLRNLDRGDLERAEETLVIARALEAYGGLRYADLLDQPQGGPRLRVVGGAS